jgi:uncharacterized RDD family membrane protein YckC
MASAAWFVEVDGEPSGPHAREELENLHARGRIAGDTLVWLEGTEAWLPYDQAGLSKLRPPPIPGKAPPPAPVEPPASRAGAPGMEIPAAWRHAPGVDADDAAPASAGPVVSDGGWQSVTPAPWRRLFARMLDTVIFSSLAWLGIGMLIVTISPGPHEELFGKDSLLMNPAMSAILNCAIMIPINALVLGLLGTTFGKWIFGVRVTRANGKAIGVGAAFGRELNVWASGLALGIPLLQLITTWSAYKHLTSTGKTGWDTGADWVVTHRNDGVLQAILAVFGLALWFVAFAAVMALSKV